MALYYQTEYRLGGRGLIRRSYTGFQAFFAILFDLVFGLVFELVAGVIGLAVHSSFWLFRSRRWYCVNLGARWSPSWPLLSGWLLYLLWSSIRWSIGFDRGLGPAGAITTGLPP